MRNDGENHKSKSEKNEGGNHRLESENEGENHESKSEKNEGENHKSKSEKNEGENQESKSEKHEGENHKSKWKKNEGGNQLRRDPYEVLGVPRNSTDQEIKSTYRKLALKYHPDKNANDPKATDMFKEITFSYSILSDPDKRHQYDTKGFEVGFRRIKAVEESQDFELDLANLGAVNTVFAAIFSKLGVPIKTSISATVLEEALNGSVSIRPLVLGQPVVSKVEKQCAHFYSVTITVKEAQGGLVCRVQSTDKSKFKLLYFEQEVNGGLSLGMQEGSRKTGKVTSAGMYFLGFPVYRFDQPSNSMTYPKDSDNAFFRKLDGFQPCEINELKAGKHTFAVYGDNFFKNVSYTIEVICAASLGEQKEDLRAIEAQILSKRVTLSKFETEYKQAIAQFKEVTSRYSQEKQVIDNLLKQRNEIHACYTIASPMRCSGGSSSSSRKMDAKDDGHHARDEKDRSNKKGWFNIHVKLGKRKP